MSDGAQGPPPGEGSTLGKRIKWLVRGPLRTTMEQAAIRVDLPSAQLGRYANDKNVPGVDFVGMFIAAYPRVAPGWLATGAGWWEAESGDALRLSIESAAYRRAAALLVELARDTDPNDSRHTDRPTSRPVVPAEKIETEMAESRAQRAAAEKKAAAALARRHRKG